MARDVMKPGTDQDSELRNGATPEEIGTAFRELAQEHVELRAGGTNASRAALAESIWAKIEARSGASTNEAPASTPMKVRSVPTQRDGIRFGDRARSSRGQVGPRPAVALRSTRVWAAALACAAVAAGALYVGSSWVTDAATMAEGARGRVTFEVDGTTVGPDRAGQGELIASEGVPIGIRLSDRSEINLQPHTTLRLAALSDGVVITRVSQGTLDVEVVHQEHTNYQFFAGPYLVKVVGTAFRLSYEPEDESLDLKMRSGVVEVLEPDGTNRIVRAGETLHLDQTNRVSSGDEVTEDNPVRRDSAEGSEEEQAVEDADSTIARSAIDQRKVTGRSLGTEADFHDLASKGKFAEIVRIAEARGVESLMNRGSASQLQELAQAARYSGRLDLAERVWRRMSSRFASSVSGNNALFFLGRLEEQRGRSSSALAHYESYLRRSGQGVYAQEAWGRKLQLSQKSGSSDVTRRTAQQYLQRFPHGPFAATARTILGESND